MIINFDPIRFVVWFVTLCLNTNWFLKSPVSLPKMIAIFGCLGVIAFYMSCTRET